MAKPARARPGWPSSSPGGPGGQGAAVAYGACDAELAVPYQPFVFASDHLLRAMPDELLERHREQFAEMAVLLPQIERRIPGTASARLAPTLIPSGTASSPRSTRCSSWRQQGVRW